MRAPAQPETEPGIEAMIALVQAAAHAGDYRNALMELTSLAEVLSEDMRAARAHLEAIEDALDELRRQAWL